MASGASVKLVRTANAYWYGQNNAGQSKWLHVKGCNKELLSPSQRLRAEGGAPPLPALVLNEKRGACRIHYMENGNICQLCGCVELGLRPAKALK